MEPQNPAMHRYDAVVIGTGQAGPPLARRGAAEDMTVAVIERGAANSTDPSNRFKTASDAA